MGRPYKKPQITCPYPASSGQIPESWSAADGFLQRSPTRICGLCSNQSTFIACFNAGETQGNLAAVFGLGRALYKISPRLLQLFFFYMEIFTGSFTVPGPGRGTTVHLQREGTVPSPGEPGRWSIAALCKLLTVNRAHLCV